MTKYILHGGNRPATKQNDNVDFFAEGIKGLNKAKILIVLFAREKGEDFDQLFQQNKTDFTNASNIPMEFELASWDLAKFREQVKWADVIYVRGGNTLNVMEQFKQVTDLPELLQGKVYMGSSAGVNVLAAYYASDIRKVVDIGLGFLPIKTIPHWKPDKQKDFEILQSMGDNLPIYKIPENEFVILEK